MLLLTLTLTKPHSASCWALSRDPQEVPLGGYTRERDDRVGIIVEVRVQLLMIEQIPQLGGETGARACSA
jgi:hypothetical protein